MGKGKDSGFAVASWSEGRLPARSGSRRKLSDFNEFRFDGLEPRTASNKYYTMNRVSEDGERIVVKVADSHLFKSPYGYGLTLDKDHVVWLKNWAVSQNWYGNEVMLTKQYFNVKASKRSNANFDSEPQNLSFEHWRDVAYAQQKAGTYVRWER